MAEKWLGWKEEEKDLVVEWIIEHKDDLPRFDWIRNAKGNLQGPTRKNAGAWIAYAPVELVRPYAIGDVQRTFHLACTLWPIIVSCGLKEAYNVERQVLPIFMQNEEVGLNVDFAGLERDIPIYQKAFDYAEEWLRWRLNAPGLNFDADADVAAILKSQGIVTSFTKTAGGADSVSKKNLHPDQFEDPQVASVLGYRNRLKTCLTMFMQPWFAQASLRPDRRISTDWNQIQGEGGGTKTGRPSTRNPNFLNVSKKFEGMGDGYVHPEFLNLPHLPLVRKYILANEGEVILKRDFSGQELHIFGHFEQGDLAAQYRANPRLDVHNYVGENINAITGATHWTNPEQRTPLKAMNFQGMYGGGIPALSAELRIPFEKARELKAFHDRALPGRKILSDTLAYIARTGRAIRTYGGRLYMRPPFKKQKDGRYGPADYVLINYLIQGSAADITKRAMIGLHKHPDFNAYFMLQVYDEMNISARIEGAAIQMRVLEEVMESIPLSTSLPTDGEWGLNWGSMHKLKNLETLEREILDEIIPF
jgi:DNA polymerase-1